MDELNDLKTLIEDLKDTIGDSSVFVDKSSRAVICTPASKKETFVLNANECKILLHSAKTVKKLVNIIEKPEEYTVTLHDVEVEDEVIEALERSFKAVDEA